MEKFRKIKPFIKWAFRIAGTGLFLWLILRSADLETVLFQINRMSILGFGFLFILFLFIQLIVSYRWKILLLASGINETIQNLFISVLYGQTINQILPSSIGGDSARIAYLFNRYPGKKSEALSSTFLDRFIGLFALLVIVFFNLPFVESFTIAQKVSGIGFLGGFMVLIMLTFVGKLDNLINRIINFKFIPLFISQQLNKFWRIYREYRVSKEKVLTAFLISLLTQGITIVSHYITFRLLGIDVLLVRLFVVFPVVFLLVALPISIGGVGVREAALAKMLSINSSEVLSFTIIRYSFYILIPVLLFLISIIQGFVKMKR